MRWFFCWLFFFGKGLGMAATIIVHAGMTSGAIFINYGWIVPCEEMVFENFMGISYEVVLHGTPDIALGALGLGGF